MTRSCLTIGVVLGAASVALGNGTLQLVPTVPGPYSPGQVVTVDMFLQNGDALAHYMPFIRLDFGATNPAIGLPANFNFDYSSLAGGNALYAEFDALAVPATVYTSASANASFLLRLPASGSRRLGNLTVTLPLTSGVYILDATNASLSDPNRGAQVSVDFCQATPWRAFTGELTGGTFAFVVGNLIFVDANANGAKNGSNWQDAYVDLQVALAAAAATSGAQIWVAAGTYTPDDKSCVNNAGCTANGGGTCVSGHCNWTTPRAQTFRLLNNVAIYGGFAGHELDLTERRPDLYKTILSGDLTGNDAGFTNNGENSYHVVTGGGTNTTAILDGFFIQGGNADAASFPNNQGGGLHNELGSPTIRNCEFAGNSADAYGGAMYNSSSTASARSCVFRGNRVVTVGGGGGAISNSGGSPTLVNCIFTGNTSANRGGAVYNNSSSPRLTNCMFSGNQAGVGGAILNETGGSPIVDSCSFSRNAASLTTGGGGIRNDAATLTIRNSVFWNNSDGGGMDESGQIHVASGTASVTYSVIQGLSTFSGNGNIDSDPLFQNFDGADGVVGTLDDDLRLRRGSPACDAASTPNLPADTLDLDNDGNTAERLPLDLDGKPRVADDPLKADTGVPGSAVVDMGAYEILIDCNLNGVPDNQDITAGTSVDANGNGIPDECVDFIGRPSGTCADPTLWSCGPNWTSNPNVPNNGSPVASSVYSPVLDALPAPGPDDVFLDIDTKLNSLTIVDDAVLHVTQTGSVGDLDFQNQARILLEGSLLTGNNRSIGASFVAPSLTVGPGGVYMHDPSVAVAATGPGGSDSSTMRNSDVVIQAGLCAPTCENGGQVDLSSAMSLTTTGSLRLNGTGASSGPCQSLTRGAEVLGFYQPPFVRVRDNAHLYVSQDVELVNAANLLISSSMPVTVGGDFRNASVRPECFDMRSGAIELNGMQPQTFEAAAPDLGPMGGVGGADYLIGSLTINTNQEVELIDRIDNTGNGNVPCTEALYVGVLQVPNGATLRATNCRVYYGRPDFGPTAQLIPDGCPNAFQQACPPPVSPPTAEPSAVPKSRYLSFVPTNAGQQTAIRVKLIDVAGFPSSNNQVRWVGPPASYPEGGSPATFMAAALQCTPHYRDWGTVGLLHVYGSAVIPGSTYAVQAIHQNCAAHMDDEFNYSSVWTAATGKWGDVIAPLNITNFQDISSIVAKFQGKPGAPIKARAQLQPATPNPGNAINFQDVSADVGAFQGKPYPYGAPTSCP